MKKPYRFIRLIVCDGEAVRELNKERCELSSLISEYRSKFTRLRAAYEPQIRALERSIQSLISKKPN